MKVIKLPQAYADLIETGEYIARDDSDAAAKPHGLKDVRE